jgi:naphtho-gamma-pyrone polyketide synthase
VAVGCATSVSSLVPLALFTVAVAARLGAVAWDLGDRINPINASEGADAPFASWTSAVAGGSTESLAEALQQHNADKVSGPGRK